MHMFNLGKLFGGSKRSDEITSLKLESRSGSYENIPVTAKSATELLEVRREQQAKFDKTPLAGILHRRAAELYETGPHPVAMYYASPAGQGYPLGFVSQDKTKGMALIFTSPVLAQQLFQVQAFNPGYKAFEVKRFQLDDMEELARGWKVQGFNAFILNMTPKKAGPAVVDARDGVVGKELLLRAWAANRASCSVLAEQLGIGGPSTLARGRKAWYSKKS